MAPQQISLPTAPDHRAAVLKVQKLAAAVGLFHLRAEDITVELEDAALAFLAALHATWETKKDRTHAR